MKSILKSILISLMLVVVLVPVAVFAAEKVESPVSCQRCGMNRVAFARSRMLVTYADGTSTGTCSIHCMAEELKGSGGKKVKAVQVADYVTGKLIDAKSAFWVIGGSKQGVMTSVAKWAFSSKQDAQAFIRDSGGRLASFDESLKLAEMEGM